MSPKTRSKVSTKSLTLPKKRLWVPVLRVCCQRRSVGFNSGEKRGKVGKPIEFGHQILLAESAQGLITQYLVLDGNPSDEDHVKDCLQRHKETFGPVPKTLATDRGFHSPDNQKMCRAAGIADVCIPQRGGKKTPERETFKKSPAFKKGQRCGLALTAASRYCSAVVA